VTGTKQPIKITVDSEAGAGYVYYSLKKVAKTSHLSQTLLVDRDSDGMVIGIEILGFNDRALQEARELANSEGLEFPQHFPTETTE
jgi:uncharacterized protein YuzE